MKKRILSLICVISLLIVLLPLQPARVHAAPATESYPYVKYDTTTQQFVTAHTPIHDNLTEHAYVCSTETTANETFGSAEYTTPFWYIITANTIRTGMISIVGNVHLLLLDGVTFEAQGGIWVPEGSSLTIYGQENQTGTLWAGYHLSQLATQHGFVAGIGGYMKVRDSLYDPTKPITITESDLTDGSLRTGDITIHSGTVKAVGGGGYGNNAGGSGIGYVHGNVSGTTTIYGGNVTVNGGAGGAGISSKIINIHGGTVNATGNSGGGAAIGSQWNAHNDTINITGGEITATSTDGYAAAIGGGEGGNGGNITISGGVVYAIAQTRNHGTADIDFPTDKSYGAAIGAGAKTNTNAIGQGGNIVITGGNITAIANEGAALGGAAMAPRFPFEANQTANGGTVTVYGGELYLTSETYAIGIGTQTYSSSATSTFLTDINSQKGNALIHSASVQVFHDSVGKANGNYMFHDRSGHYTVNGDVTLIRDFSLVSGNTLLIPAGAVFRALAGKTITNGNGAVITNQGVLENNGTIENYGTIINSGTYDGAADNSAYVHFGGTWSGNLDANDKVYFQIDTSRLDENIHLSITGAHVERTINSVTYPYALWKDTLTLSSVDPFVLFLNNELVAADAVTNKAVSMPAQTVVLSHEMTQLPASFTASAIAVAGKQYTQLPSGSSSVSVKTDGAVTVKYNLSYIDNTSVTFVFSQPMPVGTTLLLMNMTEGLETQVFHYVFEEALNHVNIAQFKQIGTAVTDKTIQNENVCYQLIVSMPPDYATAGGYTISVTTTPDDATSYQAPITVTLETHATVNIGTVSEEERYITAPVTVSTITDFAHVLAVELLDKEGTPIEFPPHSVLTLGKKTPITVRDTVAFFDDIVDGTYVLNIGELLPDDYTVKVYLCASTTKEYPLQETVAVFDKAFTVKSQVFAVTTTDNRFIKVGTTATLTFTTDGVIDGIQTKKNGEYQEGAVGITVSGKTVTVTSLAAVGTYRIVFTNDTAVRYYNIIVHN